MQLVLEDVHVQGRRGPLLQLDRLAVETGECVLVAGEPGQGHTALALVLTGRLNPDSGRVGLVRDDGSVTDDPEILREVSAVVDLPTISEPDDEVPIGAVVAEDLALAHRTRRSEAAREWLTDLGTGLDGSERVDELPSLVRTSVLTALAAEREQVRFLILALPDRHGGEPSRWWALAQEYAAAGYGLLVQSTPTSARDLGAGMGSTQRTTPEVALRTRPTPREADAASAAPPAASHAAAPGPTAPLQVDPASDRKESR